MGHKPDVKARTKHAKKIEKAAKPACYLCETTFQNDKDAADSFCYGCKKRICSDCAKNYDLWDGHTPKDHLTDA